jgi:hypothetical protein
MDSLYSGSTYTEENDPYAFGEEARKAYDQAGTSLLMPPDTARTRGKDSHGEPLWYHWNEEVTITSVEFKAPIPGNFKPEKDGDVTCILTFGLTISPTSQQDGSKSPNVNRKLTANARYNFSAYKREANGGGDFSKGHAAMTQMSNALVKSLLRALEYDPELGMRPKILAETYRENLIGKRVWVAVKQGRKNEDDQKRVDVDRFVPERV